MGVAFVYYATVKLLVRGLVSVGQVSSISSGEPVCKLARTFSNGKVSNWGERERAPF